MKYIIFDMEWNQPSAHDEKDPALAHGEIIQLGYFVLDRQMNVLYKNEITVRPVCYPKMNPYVSALTGITQEKAQSGVPFAAALREMAESFDGETLLFTWGDDDMPILRENMAFHGITDVVLPTHYNLQRIFCAQTGTPLRQIGLKTAAEQFGIDINVASHDALNDAYITLLTARKLDIERGIAEYKRRAPVIKQNRGKNPQQPWLCEEPVFSGACEYGGTSDGMADFCRGIMPACPVCGGEMEPETFCRQGKTGVVTKGVCVDDGSFFVRFSRDDIILRTDVYRLSDTFERIYRSKLRQKEKSAYYRSLHREAAKYKNSL